MQFVQETRFHIQDIPVSLIQVSSEAEPFVSDREMCLRWRSLSEAERRSHIQDTPKRRPPL